MNILEEANKITSEEKREEYGDVIENIEKIMDISNAMTHNSHFSEKDICIVLIALKLSREAYKHKRDNLVDLAGYTWVLSKIMGDA